jgi:FixJ family two-component response regulator
MKTANALVFVIDDDESVRKGLKRLLTSHDYNCEIFESAAGFLTRPPHSGPACVIVDVQMPGLNGMALQDALVQRHREEQLIFITGYGNISMCARAMKAGAVDFLPKPFKPRELLKSVEHALNRSAQQRRGALEKDGARRLLDSLTPREFEVMELVITGLLNKQVGGELGMAEKTVKVHRGRVMQKLGVSSVPELLRLVQRAGVSSATEMRLKSECHT